MGEEANIGGRLVFQVMGRNPFLRRKATIGQVFVLCAPGNAQTLDRMLRCVSAGTTQSLWAKMLGSTPPQRCCGVAAPRTQRPTLCRMVAIELGCAAQGIANPQLGLTEVRANPLGNRTRSTPILSHNQSTRPARIA
jgi:hypothetical protein